MTGDTYERSERMAKCVALDELLEFIKENTGAFGSVSDFGVVVLANGRMLKYRVPYEGSRLQDDVVLRNVQEDPRFTFYKVRKVSVTGNHHTDIMQYGIETLEEYRDVSGKVGDADVEVA